MPRTPPPSTPLGWSHRYDEAYELHSPSHDYLPAHDPFSAEPRPSMSQEEKLAPHSGAPSRFTPGSSIINSDSHPNLVGYQTETGYLPLEAHSVPRKHKSRKWWWIGGTVLLLCVIGGVLGGVLGTQLNKKGGSNNSSNVNGATDNGSSGSTGTGTGNGNNNSNNNVPQVAASGTDGSLVTMDSGETFTYVNKFGGSWAVDPANPYNSSGQAQAGVPRITDKWTWGQDALRGVNLGGWLVTEPFIAPALYEAYQNATPQAIDEFTLSQAMGANLAEKLEEHYKTFITEQDFAEITEAGLNWIRLPIGFWAIQTQEGEPYLEGVSWKYFLKAIDWARKYGLRILLDFHALPGSQNGWNHSGRGGSINWMSGIMGIANAERSLENLRSMVEFISQPGIKDVVPIIGLVNEIPAQPAMEPNIGPDAAKAFYYQAYNMIREITGIGEGNGPIIAFHDGFLNIQEWAGFLAGADRLALDQHLYLAFGDGNQNTAPPLSRAQSACSWGGGTNDTQRDFGIVLGGEWSIAMGDCGMWLNGVTNNATYDTINAATGGCKPLDEWMTWTPEFKQGMMDYAMGSMDALQNWFFWTWKIGNSTELGYPTSPMWHYRLGWKEGWIPQDPRTAGGWCKANGFCVGCYEFGFQYPATATGGDLTATVAATQVQQWGAWPPASLVPNITGTAIAALPTLTPTGTPITLPMPTSSVPGQGNGWAFPSDTRGAYVPVAGCTYADMYNTENMGIPTAACTGA